MDNETIIDLIAYRKHQESAMQDYATAEDLVTAIQHLIQRLREANPIQQQGA